MALRDYKPCSVVTASTFAVTMWFVAWTMLAVIGIPIRNDFVLHATLFGVLLALPVLTGSLCRAPAGMGSGKYGGHAGFFLPMLSTIVPIRLACH